MNVCPTENKNKDGKDEEKNRKACFGNSDWCSHEKKSPQKKENRGMWKCVDLLAVLMNADMTQSFIDNTAHFTVFYWYYCTIQSALLTLLHVTQWPNMFVSSNIFACEFLVSCWRLQKQNVNWNRSLKSAEYATLLHIISHYFISLWNYSTLLYAPDTRSSHAGQSGYSHLTPSNTFGHCVMCSNVSKAQKIK